MYPYNNKRKPRKNDGFHIMQCIARAVDERFHIDNKFFDIEIDNYNNYFEQCIQLGYVARVKEGEYIAENFNITPNGHKFHKKSKGKLTTEQKFYYGFGSTKITYEKEI